MDLFEDRAKPQMDEASHDNFVAYYERESLSPATRDRFLIVRDKALRLAPARTLDVLDVGCGAGTQSRLWAELGHRVLGVDINEELIAIARQRHQASGLGIRFDVGSATRLQVDDASVDVCLLPELLEHVPEWQPCLTEAIRVLRPGGVLYLSTTNALCPRQQEFALPLYSWYPASLKRRYERLAVTSRPELVQYAKYPAVHWFTPYQLSRYLEQRGMRCLDRFDMIDTDGMAGVKRAVVAAAKSLTAVRFLGHVMTPSTILFAVKRA